ncbi:MAG TPA: universal stress protein, partial [Thermoanaerobaculia bacterium]|nr:universal stress protein [Thermoanaerobaculia bacterium]
LVALDGSPSSEAALRRAFQIAPAAGASVTGVHVLDTAQLEASFIADLSGSVGFQPFLNLSAELRSALQAVGRAIVADFEGKRETAGLAGSGRMVEGLVVSELVAAAADADLVFLGLHGTGVRRGKALGGHADALVRRLSVPAFLSSADPAPLRRPVAAFDASERSTRALRAAAEIAAALRLPLDVLTVSSSPSEIEDRRRAAAAALDGVPAEWTFVVAEGHPEDVLVGRAPQNDLIAIGSHGHGRIVELVLGSTTERVLRRCPVSVLCVP